MNDVKMHPECISESEMGIYKLSNGKRVCFLDEFLLYLLLKKDKKKNGGINK